MSVMFAKSQSSLILQKEVDPLKKDTVSEESVGFREEDLEKAVHNHYKQVYRFAFHLTRHREDAADLTQHAYETLTRKFKEVRNAAKVRSWLQSIVYRKFIDQKRRLIRFPQVELNEETSTVTGDHLDNARQIDAKAALEALAKLEDDLRAPLILFYLEANSYKEIAEVLKLPVGTVMSRLYRGKTKLYNLMNGGEV